MKKTTLIVSLFFGVTGLAQVAPITFETGQPGATWNWTTFENPSTPAPPLLIVANPSIGGINTSAMVAKLTPLVGSPPYAGVESQHGSDIGTFTLSTSNSTVKMMVYKSVVSDVGIKFAIADGGSTGEIKVANTLINQWEELTFDFSGIIGAPTSTNIDQIVIFPDFQVRTTDNVCYFDNITFSAQTAPPSTPLTAAPTPTRPAANVISMFSNAYTNVPVDTWLTGWSAGVLTNLQIVGNDTKRYSALNYVGVETVANQINATNMLYFHVDAWTQNITAFRIKLVDFGANGIYQGTPNDDKEHELSFTPTLNGWNSYDIPMSSFTGLITKANIAQLIFSGDPAGSGTVYIDNVYFSNVALSTSEFNRAQVKLYPNPVNDLLTVGSLSIVDKVIVYNMLGQKVMEQIASSSTVVIDISKLETGIYTVVAIIDGEQLTKKIVKR